MSNMTTQVIGKAVQATLIAISRQGLFFIPAVLILSSLFGITGIQLAQPVADFCTFLIALPIQIKILNEFNK